MGVLPKLVVGRTDDPLEKEADRMADAVMAGAGTIGRPGCGCGCGAALRRRAESGAAAAGVPAPPRVGTVLARPGERLDAATRSFFEERFATDLSSVRVHTGADAGLAARSIGAQAFTAGERIVFAPDRFAPASDAGRRLLAHELAHVVQQRDAPAAAVRRRADEGAIKSSDFSYSTNCGWIDWGHSNPTFARNLIAAVRQASDALKAPPAEPAAPAATPTMKAQKFGVVFSGASLQVRLQRALSDDEVFAVALSMFKNLSVIFEVQQGWTDWFSHSSFSQEDLPSNLISFYRAAKGYSSADVRRICAASDIPQSLEEFRRAKPYGQNYGFAPMAAGGPWPAEFSTINDAAAAGLYSVESIDVTSPGGGYRFCPVYRLEGSVDTLDLLILSFGTFFSAADDVQVVPTYVVDRDRVSGEGHVPWLEVKPFRASDAATLKARGIRTPFEVSERKLVCLGGGLGGGAFTGTVQREGDGSGAIGGGGPAPAIVGDVLHQPGVPLDGGVRTDAEAVLGADLSAVRVHTGEGAAAASRAIGARAYTLGEHLVFGAGMYAPDRADGRRLIAHELAHVVQQRGGGTSPAVLRRDPAPSGPEPSLWDSVAKSVFGYGSYQEYLAGALTSTSFFGVKIGNLHPDFVKKLAVVEADLTRTQGSGYKPPAVSSVLRPQSSMHSWGMAIDFDVQHNPYVLNEFGDDRLDPELAGAYDRIADFMLGDQRSVVRKLRGGRKAVGDGTIASAYDALRRDSDAMRRYFALMNDDAALDRFLADDWLKLHPLILMVPPTREEAKAQMKEDYLLLGGAGPSGKRPVGKKGGDRPFAPSKGGGGDPAGGYLNLDKPFVVAMTDAGFAWGAIDFGGASGDIQHFDLRLSGTGARVLNAMTAYKAAHKPAGKA